MHDLGNMRYAHGKLSMLNTGTASEQQFERMESKYLCNTIVQASPSHHSSEVIGNHSTMAEHNCETTDTEDLSMFREFPYNFERAISLHQGFVTHVENIDYDPLNSLMGRDYDHNLNVTLRAGDLFPQKKGTTETIKALLPILTILFPMSTYLKRGLSCSVIPLIMFPLSNVTIYRMLPRGALSTYLKRGSQ